MQIDDEAIMAQEGNSPTPKADIPLVAEASMKPVTTYALAASAFNAEAPHPAPADDKKPALTDHHADLLKAMATLLETKLEDKINPLVRRLTALEDAKKLEEANDYTNWGGDQHNGDWGEAFAHPEDVDMQMRQEDDFNDRLAAGDPEAFAQQEAFDRQYQCEAYEAPYPDDGPLPAETGDTANPTNISSQPTPPPPI